jgi:hypothetical protein
MLIESRLITYVSATGLQGCPADRILKRRQRLWVECAWILGVGWRSPQEKQQNKCSPAAAIA